MRLGTAPEFCHDVGMAKSKRLRDIYRFPGFVPSSTLRGVFGGSSRPVISCQAAVKTVCGVCGEIQFRHYDKRPRGVRDLSCGDRRIYLAYQGRRVDCRRCQAVKNEGLEWLADNPLYTKRFAYYVGRRCRATTIRELAEELLLDWHTVKELDKQWAMASSPACRHQDHRAAIGIDEISVGRGHEYRIVVSDLIRGRPIWFGGEDRSEKSLRCLLRLVWPGKLRENTPRRHGHVESIPQLHPQRGERAPQALIVYDKFS